MLILNADADEERQQELLERVQQLLRADSGVIHHVDDWGRRKLAYVIQKHDEGRYVVITCTTEPAAIAEMQRVLAISRDVAIRHTVVRLNRLEAERALAEGAKVPVDEPRERDERPQRGGRGGGGRGGGGRRPR